MPGKCPVLIALLFLVAAFTHQTMIPIACAGFDEAVAAYDRGEFTAAYEEFKSLAEQGDADAQWNLGMMYYNGQGVEQDSVEAVKWFQKSAEQGDADSQLGLGWMYANGKGIPQNLVLAHKWLNAAALQGSKAAINGVDSVAKMMTPEQITEAQHLEAQSGPKGGDQPITQAPPSNPESM